MDTETKTMLRIDGAKAASKRLVQKTAEATGDLTGNKITDRLISVGTSKNKQKEKKDETNEVEEIYILPEKRQQIIEGIVLKWNTKRLQIYEATHLIKYLDLLLKNGYKFMINLEGYTMVTSK